MAHVDFDVFNDVTPIIYVVSDARGDTAAAVVKAAAAQFESGVVDIVRVTNITSVEALQAYFNENFDPEIPCAVFHTIADTSLRHRIRHSLDELNIPSIDLLGPAVSVVSTLTGLEPSYAIGATLA